MPLDLYVAFLAATLVMLVMPGPNVRTGLEVAR
jgi:threonine/homoserine/homoserine lactone efflux protein